jgi:uncharacterized membrane protein YjjP (DUF1212 family)
MTTDPNEAMDKLTNQTADKLRMELIRVQMEGIKLAQEGMRQRLEARIDSHRDEIADHEKRIRSIEEATTKFNFILYLTMGGGLVGLINLALLAFTLLKNLNP